MSESNATQQFEHQYHAFVATHGIVYSKKMVPMLADDLKAVARSHRFTQWITFPFFILVAGSSLYGSIYLLYAGDMRGLGFLLCAIALAAFAFYLKTFYAGLLSLKEKVVIEGIVTKKSESKGMGVIRLSDQDEILVDWNDAKKLELGDVIEIQCLSQERYIKNTVQVKGSIFRPSV